MANSTPTVGEPPIAELQGSVAVSAARGVAWMGLDSTVNQAVSLGVFIVLGRLLEPRAFGLVASAAVVLWLLRVVVDQGFSSALIQRGQLTSIDIDTAFWTAVVTGTAVAALTVATAPLIADLFSQPRLAAVMRVVSVVFVLAALDGTQSALLTRAMDFRSQALRRLAATFVSAVAAIVLAATGAGVWALVAQLVTFESVSVVLLWSLADWRPSFRFSRASFRELLTFGASVTGIRFLTNVARARVLRDRVPRDDRDQPGAGADAAPSRVQRVLAVAIGSGCPQRCLLSLFEPGERGRLPDLRRARDRRSPTDRRGVRR
jgi:O-antigen/teichoic acid export membrane protein